LFTFQRVQHEDLIAHTMYVDDWETVA